MLFELELRKEIIKSNVMPKSSSCCDFVVQKAQRFQNQPGTTVKITCINSRKKITKVNMLEK